MRMKRTTAVWAALAVAGLIVAVGVSYAASQLSKPSVGLTNEPVSAGVHLAPKPVTPKAHPAVLRKPKRHHKPRSKRPATPPAPAATATPAQQAPVTPAPRPVAPAPRPAPAPKPAPAKPRGDDHGGSDHSGSGHRGGDDGSGKDD